MLTRRTFLTAVGVVGLGCSKDPELPPAALFLTALRLMDRKGTELPDEWVVSQANPIDPTIQYETVAPPSVLVDRKVSPPESWIIVAEVRNESNNPQWAELFYVAKTFGEETIDGQGNSPIWESPDAPTSLPLSVTWRWLHCRFPHRRACSTTRIAGSAGIL